jgi:hypothetical protein
MIVQVSEPVEFEGAARLVVPFQQPTRPASLIAVAFMLESAALTIVRVTDNTAGPRAWRLGNDTPAGNGRRVAWVRAGGPPGVTEVTGEAANGKPVCGTALAVEAQVRGPGDALQLLADLLTGAP